MGTSYKQCIVALKSAIAFTTSLWWILLFVIILSVLKGVSHSLLICIICVFIVYSSYLWYFTVSADVNQPDYVGTCGDEEDLAVIERSCSHLEEKWRAIGSPQHLRSVDMIQFLHSLLPWRSQNTTVFDDFITLCDELVVMNVTRDTVFRYFHRHFHDYCQFQEAYRLLTYQIADPTIV